jgi:hypothetical protein
VPATQETREDDSKKDGLLHGNSRIWNKNETKRKYYKGPVHSMLQNGVIRIAGCTKSIFVHPRRLSAFVGRLCGCPVLCFALCCSLQTSSNRRLLQVQTAISKALSDAALVSS